MSSWYEIEDYDINVDIEANNVEILVHTDYHGNVYAELSCDQIKSIYAKIIDEQIMHNMDNTEEHF